jgi:hypothetical protein
LYEPAHLPALCFLGDTAVDPGNEQHVFHTRLKHRRPREETVGIRLMKCQKADFIAYALLTFAKVFLSATQCFP